MTGAVAPVVVRTEGLTKRFPEGLVAVDDLDLEVFEGDLYGFLGPNGAGKSTTIRMLLGLVFPTTGSVEVLGQAVPRHSSEALLDVGALIEGPGLLPPPVGAPEPPPVRRRRAQRVPGHAAPAHRGGHGARRPGRRGPPPGQGLLDGHAPAPRPGRGPPAPAPPADPRRAHQRPRPPGHPRAQDPLRRARPRGDDGVPVQPPPRRGGAHLHPGGHDGQRQARRPGPGGRAAGADRTAAHRVARRLGGRGLPAHPPHDGRVARPAPPAGAPQRGPAEAVNSLLVGQGLRVRELARERPTLEDVFLGLTGGAPSEPSAEPLPSPLPSPAAPPSGEDRPSPAGAVVEDGS